MMEPFLITKNMYLLQKTEVFIPLIMTKHHKNNDFLQEKPLKYTHFQHASQAFPHFSSPSSYTNGVCAYSVLKIVTIETVLKETFIETFGQQQDLNKMNCIVC